MELLKYLAVVGGRGDQGDMEIADAADFPYKLKEAGNPGYREI